MASRRASYTKIPTDPATGIGAPVAGVLGAVALGAGAVTAGVSAYQAWDTCTNTAKGSCGDAIVTAAIDTALALPGAGIGRFGSRAANTAAKACSFAGTTTVLMADGTKKPIDQIKVGDEVLATDPETGEQRPKKVEHVFVHFDALADLQLADGTVLTTTEDHPYWSVDDQRFERADELSDGERVLGADGRTIKVSGLRLATTRDGLAYNLSVEGIHTYHVGVDEILVHNTCKWVPKKPGYTENKVGLPSAAAAEEAARDAAAVGGRCRFRGLCGSGNHYHVDYFNNDGLIFHTTLFRFPIG